MAQEHGQQPPIATYVKVWGLLFVLAGASYSVGYFHVEGLLRWVLLVVLMLLQAGLIISLLMHLVWERLALVFAIILPPLLLITLIGIGALDGLSTVMTRNTFFGAAATPAPAAEHQ
ncbi:MAG TPA: cytochrome C oxidase subunit IV family protein [Burkholderiaceae bacterium]|jgi:cytochrome c oxidase subunit IV